MLHFSSDSIFDFDKKKLSLLLRNMVFGLFNVFKSYCSQRVRENHQGMPETTF